MNNINEIFIVLFITDTNQVRIIGTITGIVINNNLSDI